MIATLRLEAIGDNYARLRKQGLKQAIRQVGRQPGHAAALLSRSWRPWVARLTRHGTRFEREFLDGLRDYRDANKGGSRGVYLTYVLRADAVYEVHELVSWNHTRRYFCRANGGSILEMTVDEVHAWFDQRVGALQALINKAART